MSSPASAGGATRPANRRTVLVIDDDDNLRGMLQEALTAAGYDVVAALNGSQLAAALGSSPVDLVLTDLLMPEKDGMEVLKELRRTRPELPVIVMSGGGFVSPNFYLDLASVIGARGVLRKPFSRDALLGEVDKALAGT